MITDALDTTQKNARYHNIVVSLSLHSDGKCSTCVTIYQRTDVKPLQASPQHMYAELKSKSVQKKKKKRSCNNKTRFRSNQGVADTHIAFLQTSSTCILGVCTLHPLWGVCTYLPHSTENFIITVAQKRVPFGGPLPWCNKDI